MNVAEVAPAPTVTDPGTVSVVFVFVSVTTAPPLGAAPLKVTVHAALLERLNVEGVHDKTVTIGKGAVPITVPPVPDSAMAFPAAEAAMVLLNALGVLLTPAANDRFTTATVPFETVPPFMPETRQEYAPEGHAGRSFIGDCDGECLAAVNHHVAEIKS